MVTGIMSTAMRQSVFCSAVTSLEGLTPMTNPRMQSAAITATQCLRRNRRQGPSIGLVEPARHARRSAAAADSSAPLTIASFTLGSGLVPGSTAPSGNWPAKVKRPQIGCWPHTRTDSYS